MKKLLPDPHAPKTPTDSGVAVLRDDSEAAPLPELPPGAVRVDAWAPYWTLADTLPETDERFSDLRERSPFWYSAVAADRIIIDQQAPFDDADYLFAQFIESMEKR